MKSPSAMNPLYNRAAIIKPLANPTTIESIEENPNVDPKTNLAPGLKVQPVGDGLVDQANAVNPSIPYRRSVNDTYRRI